MLQEAGHAKDPEVRALALKAAERYYRADIRLNTPVPMWALLLMLLVSCATVLGAFYCAFIRIGIWKASIIAVVSFAFISLILSIVLRVFGYISESSLMGIWKEGFKILGNLRKNKAPDSPTK